MLPIALPVRGHDVADHLQQSAIWPKAKSFNHLANHGRSALFRHVFEGVRPFSMYP
jgi:hypothetical protein